MRVTVTKRSFYVCEAYWSAGSMHTMCALVLAFLLILLACSRVAHLLISLEMQ